MLTRLAQSWCLESVIVCRWWLVIYDRFFFDWLYVRVRCNIIVHVLLDCMKREATSIRSTACILSEKMNRFSFICLTHGFHTVSSRPSISVVTALLDVLFTWRFATGDYVINFAWAWAYIYCGTLVDRCFIRFIAVVSTRELLGDGDGG